MKATLAAPLSEEYLDFKIGQDRLLNPLGDSRLRYSQPGDTYSTNPSIDVMRGSSRLREFGAVTDVLKHTGCLRHTTQLGKSLGRGDAVVFSKTGEK